ncbi:hypothetical protein BS47DRAFT_1398686 [Hydnum rufescens UP504]|uniref:Copper acquisition factor BIM1-like domain-containing protein n=1 Tax=Hydnum rufescens UP504 TaxID=1448309 RepID=A0A9P6AKN9_9AGAM|nr:hypothetical protein BS47DRAFT_1398686 [Hydnum rufescens UP504]
MVSAKILALSAFTAACQAHFTLDYPWTRGFSDVNALSLYPWELQINHTMACSIGLRISSTMCVNNTRTPFPLSGGFIEYSSYHSTADSIAAVSFSSDPTTLSNFNTTPSGVTYGLLLPSWSTTVQGSFCVHVNVSSLGVSAATDGSNATILMIYNGGDGVLHQAWVLFFLMSVRVLRMGHQCSDVVLLANYTIPSSISCTSSGSITGGSTTPGSPSATSKGAPLNPTSNPHSAGSASASVNGFLAAIGLVVTALFV